MRTTRTSSDEPSRFRRTAAFAAVLACCFAIGCGGSATGAANASTLAATDSENASGSFQPEQGATAYGVYLVSASSGDDPEVERTLAELRERGINAGAGELGCDHGAPEALALPPETIAVSVDFRTRDEAAAFAASWSRPVLGIAEFVAYCRD